MKKCGLCKDDFETQVVIDGKKRNLQRRKYCLKCSPFGSGNTAKLSRYGETFPEFQQNGQPKRKRQRNKQTYTKYQKDKREERKIELAKMLGGKCARCGYDACIASLDFHHRDANTKSFGISHSGLLLKWERLVEEALKCDLLCKNCHSQLHYLGDREGFSSPQ